MKAFSKGFLSFFKAFSKGFLSFLKAFLRGSYPFLRLFVRALLSFPTVPLVNDLEHADEVATGCQNFDIEGQKHG